ncbi:MAG TPA: hypothetical protein ENI85_04335 [Deltaproteobacteria bacterium]|nr:hypothetical protein [Deltaproteobacteria bacterium]
MGASFESEPGRAGLSAGAGNEDGTPARAAGTASRPDYDRDLGVIEAITIVTRSCPNGGAIAVARQALEAIKTGGPEVLRQQAYFVLIAIRGWRGERARQVHRSLSRYLGLESDD